MNPNIVSLLSLIVSIFSLCISSFFGYQGYRSTQESITFFTDGINTPTLTPFGVEVSGNFRVSNASNYTVSIISLSCNNLEINRKFHYRPCRIEDSVGDSHATLTIKSGEAVNIKATTDIEPEGKAWEIFVNLRRNRNNSFSNYTDVLLQNGLDVYGDSYSYEGLGKGYGISLGRGISRMDKTRQGFIFFVQTSRENDFTSPHFEVSIGPGDGF